MEIIDLSGKRSRVVIDHEELLIINAALNEICNGIALFEFESRIGADREDVTKLLKAVGQLLDRMHVE